MKLDVNGVIDICDWFLFWDVKSVMLVDGFVVLLLGMLLIGVVVDGMGWVVYSVVGGGGFFVFDVDVCYWV